MSRSGEIRLQFGLEEHTFRLGIKQWDRLDEATQVGPSVLLARMATVERQAQMVLGLFPALAGELTRFRQTDVREVLYQGLLGGGTPMPAAAALVRKVQEEGGFPPLLPVAFDVVWAGFMGVAVEAPAGEPAGAQPDPPPSQTDGSGSGRAASTQSAPRRASRRRKSTT